MICIRPIKRVTKLEVEELNSLIKQLRSKPESHKRISQGEIQRVLDEKTTFVLVVRDGKRIIGTGTLVIETILTGRDGSIEDVVVDDEYRGQGLGKRLVSALIALARKKKVDTIYLTSRPSRVAANKLYQSLGFARKETNNYEMKL